VERHPAFAATVRAVGEDWTMQRSGITRNMITELINSAGALESRSAACGHFYLIHRADGWKVWGSY
jgi:hypothetical protein